MMIFFPQNFTMYLHYLLHAKIKNIPFSCSEYLTIIIFIYLVFVLKLRYEIVLNKIFMTTSIFLYFIQE